MTAPAAVLAWAGLAEGRLEWWHQAAANVRAAALGLPEPIAPRAFCPHCGRSFPHARGLQIHIGRMHQEGTPPTR